MSNIAYGRKPAVPILTFKFELFMIRAVSFRNQPPATFLCRLLDIINREALFLWRPEGTIRQRLCLRAGP